MTYMQYIPQPCRKEKKNIFYEPHSNNTHQLYKCVLRRSVETLSFTIENRHYSSTVENMTHIGILPFFTIKSQENLSCSDVHKQWITLYLQIQ